MRPKIVFPDRGMPENTHAFFPNPRLDAWSPWRPFDSSDARRSGSMHESLNRKLLGGIDEYSTSVLASVFSTVARQRQPLYQPASFVRELLDCGYAGLARPFPHLIQMSGSLLDSGSSNRPHSDRRKLIRALGPLTWTQTRP